MLQITAKLTEKLEVYIKDGIVQNNEGELGKWFGSNITEEVDLRKILEQVKELPNGNYKINLVIERIN